MILIATGLAAQTGSSSGSSVWQRNSPTPPPTSSNAGAGTLYRDAHGAFSIMIPEGWAARPNVGCYGPNKNNCPENAAGVNPNLYLRGTYTQLENVDPMKPY